MSQIIKKRNKGRVPFWFTYGTLGVFLMFIGLTTVLAISSLKRDITKVNVAQISNHVFQLDTQTSRFILRNGIPVLDQSAGEDDPFTLFHFNWVEFYWNLAANTRHTTPQEIIKAQLPLLALSQPKPQPITYPQNIPVPTPTPIPKPKSLQFSQPIALVYHTHTSESYIPVSGKDHLLNKQGDIVQVGLHLQQILEEKYGINTLHSDQIHDQYPFRESYKRSQRTLIKYLKDYPSLRILLDVHRDATPGLASSCDIKGLDTATLMIVVGSDKMGLPHPNWKKNYEFAVKLNDAMNQYYPGLSNGIIVSNARYNQHLSEHALIVEFGDQNSKLEQVYRAADLFAEILAITINQEFSSIRTTSTN